MLTQKEYFQFYNELGDKYPESEMVYATPMGINRKKFIVQLLRRRKLGLTLDIGCNDGVYQPYIKNYVGLDIALPCLRKFEGSRVWGLVECLPFNEKIFDTILMVELLEHMQTPEERRIVLEECYRVLRNTGSLILGVPFGNNPYKVRNRRQVRKYKKWGLVPRPYIHGAFSLEYTKDLLQENRFQVKFIQNLNNLNIVTIAVKG